MALPERGQPSFDTAARRLQSVSDTGMRAELGLVHSQPQLTRKNHVGHLPSTSSPTLTLLETLRRTLPNGEDGAFVSARRELGAPFPLAS